MAALDAARLPERLKQKEGEFQAARAKLSQSVDALEPALRTNQEKAIKEAIEALHSNYQSLDKVF
jgi:cytochrome c556